MGRMWGPWRPRCEPSRSVPDPGRTPSAVRMRQGPPIRADGSTGGRLYVGTSGFAYTGWSPRFYPAGLRADAFLGHYAGHLGAVELNNTYYQQPTPSKVDAWLAATPPGVPVHGQGPTRWIVPDDERRPRRQHPWLTAPYRRFGDRLGTVLLRVPDGSRRDHSRLVAALDAWPPDLPLTMEFQDPSWHVDETFAALADAGAALCATELPEDAEPPTIRRTGPFLYLRLRRHDYGRRAGCLGGTTRAVPGRPATMCSRSSVMTRWGAARSLRRRSRRRSRQAPRRPSRQDQAWALPESRATRPVSSSSSATARSRSVIEAKDSSS